MSAIHMSMAFNLVFALYMETNIQNHSVQKEILVTVSDIICEFVSN